MTAPDHTHSRLPQNALLHDALLHDALLLEALLLGGMDEAIAQGEALPPQLRARVVSFADSSAASSAASLAEAHPERVLRANREVDRRWRRTFWRVAALVLIVAGAGLVWMLQPQAALAGIRPLFVERMDRSSSVRTMGHRERGQQFLVGQDIVASADELLALGLDTDTLVVVGESQRLRVTALDPLPAFTRDGDAATSPFGAISLHRPKCA